MQTTNIGSAVQHFRKKLGLNQIELARKAGVHLSTIQKWEQHRVEPEGPNLRAVCEALGVDMAALQVYAEEWSPPGMSNAKARGREQPAIGPFEVMKWFDALAITDQRLLLETLMKRQKHPPIATPDDRQKLKDTFAAKQGGRHKGNQSGPA